MKKLLAILGVAMMVSSAAQAVVQQFTIAQNTTLSNLITYPCRIYSISTYCGGVSNDQPSCLSIIYDSGYTNTTSKLATMGWRYNGYPVHPQMTISSYTTNWTAMTTNFFGWTNIVTYSNVLMTVTNTSSSNFVLYPIISQAVIASNETTAVSFSEPYTASHGVVLYLNGTGTTNIVAPTTVTINYEPLL